MKPNRSKRVLLGAAGLLVVGAAVAVLLDRRGEEGPPPAGPCARCGGPVTAIVYESIPNPDVLEQVTLPNGKTYARWRRGQETLFAGDCVVAYDSPGWICEKCCRTWLRPNRPSLWQRVADRVRRLF